MINDVEVPFAVMLVWSAVFMSFVEGPNVVVTLTVPSLKLDDVAFTVAVPGNVVDCNVTVA